MKERFDVTGMTCSACSSHVEKSVSKLTGVENVSVNLLTNSMQVEFDENKLDTAGIIKAVEDAGYGAEVKDGHAKSGTNIRVKPLSIVERRITMSNHSPLSRSWPAIFSINRKRWSLSGRWVFAYGASLRTSKVSTRTRQSSALTVPANMSYRYCPVISVGRTN